MDNKYIVNGDVARDKIAMDIVYRVIDGPRVEQLCDDPTIKAAFFGDAVYADKRPRREWNEDYLNLLSCAVVAESFNRDYLLHLDEVADFVSKATVRRIVAVGTIIILVIIGSIIVYRYTTQTLKEHNETNVVYIINGV